MATLINDIPIKEYAASLVLDEGMVDQPEVEYKGWVITFRQVRGLWVSIYKKRGGKGAFSLIPDWWNEDKGMCLRVTITLIDRLEERLRLKEEVVRLHKENFAGRRTGYGDGRR